jgi:nucleotide-binding universal stress UspA family protein
VNGGPPDEQWSWDQPLRLPEINSEIGSLLVAVDGSAGSERALAYANLIAGKFGARVVVVVAYDPPVTVRRRGILEVEGARAEMEADAKEIASEAVQLLTGVGLEASATVVRGDPAEAIIETGETEGVDMIVMGRRGMGRLKGLLVGSVSERVVRHSAIPVVLVN